MTKIKRNTEFLIMEINKWEGQRKRAEAKLKKICEHCEHYGIPYPDPKREPEQFTLFDVKETALAK